MTDRGRPYALPTLPPRDGESMEECLERLMTQIDALRKERVRIAAILDAFRQAPLSVSSVQPVLNLAEELNGVSR